MASSLKQVCHKAASGISRTRSSAPCSRDRAQHLQWQCSRHFSSTPSPAARSKRASQSPFDDLDEVPKDFDVENLPSIALQELQTHRELRALARQAAWEMPLLSTLSKPFVPPTRDQPLRWRYTTYLGELHPASRKVVLEFSPLDLPGLSDKQRTKLCKLAGPRYNTETQIVKMSCENFETQAQNKRYLGEVLEKLIAEAKDPSSDAFEDIPLDSRHMKSKATRSLRFPEEWKMTVERRAELDARNKASTPQVEAGQGTPSLSAGLSPDEAAMLESLERAVAGVEGEVAQAVQVESSTQASDAPATPRPRIPVDGIAAIETARKISVQKVEEPIMASARQPVPSGKMGKKQLGQQQRAQRPR